MADATAASLALPSPMSPTAANRRGDSVGVGDDAVRDSVDVADPDRRVDELVEQATPAIKSAAAKKDVARRTIDLSSIMDGTACRGRQQDHIRGDRSIASFASETDNPGVTPPPIT